MIRVEKVNKYFNRFRKNRNHVINNTTLTLGDTGLVALLGPSGSGKTTLLNAIGGLDKVDSGKIYINNKKITSKFIGYVDKLRNLNIGYIFQDYKLVDNMSVYDNVALSLKTIGIKDKKEIDKRVTYVLEKMQIYRFRKRPASMLSGGERQRVGIARAIVKNPNIIIADEPTGNLDSKNSLEIMNIIKKISEDRLVILVTHEVNLAMFYADRIIEIEDGKVIKDYENTEENNLDYAIDNNIYLRDIANSKRIEIDNSKIDLYFDNYKPCNLQIVVKGNNIFIRSVDNQKIEVVDDNSSIQFIDDNYKSIAKSDIENYSFDFNSILTNNKKLKYSSIFNPLTFISNGFSKVFSYSLVKKILLFGFFLSGLFIIFSTSRIAANLKIEDKDFVNINQNYLEIIEPKIDINDYYNYEKSDKINYIIPGNSEVAFNLKVDDYYQTANTSATLSGSLASLEMIDDSDIILGRLPSNDYEVVVDYMTIDNMNKNINLPKMMGLNTKEDFLNRIISISQVGDFKIVGMVDLESPSIYAKKDKFINMLYFSKNSDYGNSGYNYIDYNLYADKITIKEGRLPYNDYEVLVNINMKEEAPLNKEYSLKINDKKLTIVGYYDSDDRITDYFVNPNMIKLLLVQSSENIMVYPKNREETIEYFKEYYDANIVDSYENSKNQYLEKREAVTKLTITSSIVVLIISLIEMFLMLRSSFLSRIKEVGIYRAIGLKKKDIYIMFSGEILAITTIASIPGVLLGTYIFYNLSKMQLLANELFVNVPLVIITILIIYIFNLLFGLYPVFLTIRKRPAQILSRTDIE